MEQIINLGELDVWGWFITGILILVGITSIYKIVTEVSVMIKKPIGVMKQRQADHELTIQNSKAIQELSKKHEEDNKQSIYHDEMIRDDIRRLTDTVESISARLDAMQNKIDSTELAKLKEKILGYYRKYKDIGEWERFEADVFWGLFDSYIKHGGNSFVKHDIEPVMRNLKIID
jgi:hypothetical protein